METLTFKAPPELLAKLEAIAAKEERSKGFLVRKAVEAYLAELEEDAEDYRIAMERLKKKERTWTMEEVEAKLGLAD